MPIDGIVLVGDYDNRGVARSERFVLKK